MCPQFLSTPSDFFIKLFKSGNSMVSYIPEDPFSSPCLWWMQHYHTCSGTFYIFLYFRQTMSIFLWSQLHHVNTIFLLRYFFLNHSGLNLSILVRLLGQLATEEKLPSCSVQYMFWRENTCPYVNSVRRQLRQVLCLTELTCKLTELTNPPITS